MRQIELLMHGYNLRRWCSWPIGLASLICGGFLVADYGGALVGLGFSLTIWALSQEIRAGLFPIGMAAIDELGRTEEP